MGYLDSMVYETLGKRLLDIALSLVAVILLSPVLILVAFSVWVSDGKPILFRQQRIGGGGSSFEFFKFRSMPTNTVSVASDQLGQIEISTVGRVIRRSNLDELPQLFNILKGDMSLVGPRPALPDQEELLALRNKNGAAALKPGLTGLAQINSYDGMSASEKASFDGEYAASVSFANDLSIIARTFRYLAKPPPVY